MSLLSYPGIKQLCEDKRVRRFGIVDPKEYEDYLKAESFVIDMRDYCEKEFKDMKATYEDLKLLNIDKPPCSRFVLHAIVIDENKVERVVSYLVFDGKEFVECFDTQKEADLHLSKFDKDEEFNKRFTGFGAQTYFRFIVLLATRYVIKERHDSPKNRLIDVNNVHKKGTGGYTIIEKPSFRGVDKYLDPVGLTKRAHFRRGHIRKFHPKDKQRWVWVSSCFVNGEPEVQRKAYLAA